MIKQQKDREKTKVCFSIGTKARSKGVDKKRGFDSTTIITRLLNDINNSENLVRRTVPLIKHFRVKDIWRI